MSGQHSVFNSCVFRILRNGGWKWNSGQQLLILLFMQDITGGLTQSSLLMAGLVYVRISVTYNCYIELTAVLVALLLS